MVGAFFGALLMFYIMYTDNKLLKIDAEVGHSFGDGVEVTFEDGKPQNLPEIRKYMETTG